jgi:hypothetical protein
MPTRVITVCEKNVYSVPHTPILLPANAQYNNPAKNPVGTPTPVLGPIRSSQKEIAARYIQNTDPNNSVYIAYGHPCDTTNFSFIIGPLQQFDASNCGDAVYCYSTAVVTVVPTTLVREDLAVTPQIMNQDRS